MRPARLALADVDADAVIRTVDEATSMGRMRDPGTRGVEELLRCLGLLRDGHLVNAAAVLFGRAACLATAYPQCTLRLARFSGRDSSALVEGWQARENVFQALRRAERFIGCPSAAVRQALVNAVCGRDYGMAGGSVGLAIFADRVELSYSGARCGTRPRNPSIARVLYLRGWWNDETGRMDVHQLPGHVVVRLRRRHEAMGWRA